MNHAVPILLAEGPLPGICGLGVALIAGGFLAWVLLTYGGLWFQAYMSRANVSLPSLIGMSLRRVNSRVIVRAKIMAMQAGIGLLV